MEADFACGGRSSPLGLYLVLLGMGNRLFRADFFSRAKATPASYNETRFHQFLATYTDSLNHTFVPLQAIPSPEAASGEIKSLYAGLPAHYGLTKPCSFHNPKRSFLISYTPV